MYDLEVISTLHWSEKYRERIDSFRRYGLLNIGARRVHLTLLTGRSGEACGISGGIDALGWPCDVTIVAGEKDAQAPKVCEYLASLASRGPAEARWYLRVDDDSLTDVSGLLDRLDSLYDERDIHYIMCDYVRDLWPPYREILAELDAGYLLPENDHDKGAFIHEWEGCVLSRSALTRITAAPLARRFLERCASLDDGVADHPLAVAAALARVHPADCAFLTAQAAVDNFTLFGGRFAHIHYVAPDKPEWPHVLERLAEAGLAPPQASAQIHAAPAQAPALVHAEAAQVPALVHAEAGLAPADAEPLKTLFVLVADNYFYPGAAACVAAVRQFHPGADIAVVNNHLSKNGLSGVQKRTLEAARARIVDAERLRKPGRRLAAWELKAYGASELSGGYDVLIGIDSDCFLCEPMDDVIRRAVDTGKFLGGSDGSTHYDDSYGVYGIATPAHNPKYMSTSLYACALTEGNRRILARWAECSNDAVYGGGGVYPGHGDQGLLNAVIFAERGPEGIELLNNHLWSQHWCYWDDVLALAEDPRDPGNAVLINSAVQERQRAIHCASSEKFWSAEHAAKLLEHPDHGVNYARFLALLWFGACRDRAINPYELIAPESHHLIVDAECLCAQIALASPRLVLGFPG
jgi:hypothetical protein